MNHQSSSKTIGQRQVGAEQAAWVFYLIAALGSTIGQIWVGVATPPWPIQLDWWWRALMVAPFAAVIDLGGVVTSAFADVRQRLGESAYGWRILSASSVTTAVGINIVGHADQPYLSVAFGGLGMFAYTVWLLHTAARRRDALRAAGKLAGTAPVYGFSQWRREPTITRRARSLAMAHGYSLHESLDLARQQRRDEQRRAALAKHVETLIRSRHQDPVVAAIAVTTLDIDAVAVELTAQADTAGWASVIGASLLPPQPPRPNNRASVHPASSEPGAPTPPTSAPIPRTDVLRRVPTSQDAYDRWRQLWAELAANPDTNSKAFATRHGISVRQVQWIRSVGATGLLDSPIPPAVRMAHLAKANDHRTREAPPNRQ